MLIVGVITLEIAPIIFARLVTKVEYGIPCAPDKWVTPAILRWAIVAMPASANHSETARSFAATAGTHRSQTGARLANQLVAHFKTVQGKHP